MKKFTYLVIATAALGMVACTGGNKAGYVITGTVEGAADGDTVYLQEATGRNLTKLDTAVISKGTFTFEGTQDSVVNRYVTCEVNGEPLMIDFFLENGKINIALTKDNDSAALLEQIPANFQNDETIVKVKEQTEKQKKTAVGTKFIDFEMQTPEGKTVKLSDYAGKGKVVLVDFWASWCGPCRREMPNLVEAYAQYKGKNFEIVGVSLDQDAAAWKESIKKLNMTWPQMSDLKFWQSEGAQLYAVNSIPHTVLIDGDGTIIARGLHGEGLQAKLAEVVK